MVRIEGLKKEYIDRVLPLMGQTRAAVFGIESPLLVRAICRDAFADRRVNFLVASEEGMIVGYVIAVIDRGSYRKKFLMRHPVPGLYAVAAGIIKKILPKDKKSLDRKTGMPDGVSAGNSGRNWKDSGPSTAKIINIGVSGAHRKRGVGKALYKELFAVLKNKGVKRVDANIDYGNMPSVRLHLSAGWKVEKRDSNLFASIDI